MRRKRIYGQHPAMNFLAREGRQIPGAQRAAGGRHQCEISETQGPPVQQSCSLVRQYITIQNSPVSSAKWSGALSSYNSPCQYTISRSGFCLQWHAEFPEFHSHLIVGKRDRLLEKMPQQGAPLTAEKPHSCSLGVPTATQKIQSLNCIWKSGGRIPQGHLVSQFQSLIIFHLCICTFICLHVCRCTCLPVRMEARG